MSHFDSVIAEAPARIWVSVPRERVDVIAQHATTIDRLVPAHESLHFLQGNGAIVVGIHRPKDALVRRLKLLQ
jgi:hypothetical protein